MRRKTGFSPHVIITDRPNAVLSLRFHLLYVRCCQFLNVLILTLLCVLLFNLVKLLSCHLFGKELLSRLIICYFVVC